MTIIGYLIIRLLNQQDIANKRQDTDISLLQQKMSSIEVEIKPIPIHQQEINNHSESLSKLWAAHKTLESANKAELKSMNDKLERILDKMDQYDINIKEFYLKYKLDEK